jgi:novel protein kinase C delta type
MDVSYFESAFTADEPLLTPVEATFLEAVNQTQFKGFSYTNPNYTLS